MTAANAREAIKQLYEEHKRYREALDYATQDIEMLLKEHNRAETDLSDRMCRVMQRAVSRNKQALGGEDD